MEQVPVGRTLFTTLQATKHWELTAQMDKPALLLEGRVTGVKGRVLMEQVPVGRALFTTERATNIGSRQP